MAVLKVRRLGYALGAEITGVDVSRDLDGATVADIRSALLDNVVICFPGQRLDATTMPAFCRRFGELEDNRSALRLDPRHPGVIVVANRPLTHEGEQARAYGANHWHSDYSNRENPTTITFLAAQTLPQVGGDTMFVNMYAAYDSLSPALKATVERLWGVHDFTLGPGYRASSPEQQAKSRALNPPVKHPVVRIHPETGRKALYVGSRVRNFAGFTEEESRPLLDVLLRHATRYELVYRHRWNVGDLMIWDNRCAIHYAVQDYDLTQLRSMLRCSLLGPKVGEPYDPSKAFANA